AALEESFCAVGARVQKGVLPIGGTDAVSFKKAGLAALTVVGLPLNRLHPTYHTRLDRPEYVQEKALQLCIEATVHFARRLDAQLG
ncbi:MAG: M28 family peptidase, partial [Bacteroidia bacterium]|nr:M28 family peptidase [Bacteroidia bacterium]